tara:strand:+ start:1396 stop:1761 length:366 start_codon:yes stop_codon:yes gene_type:complete
MKTRTTLPPQQIEQLQQMGYKVTRDKAGERQRSKTPTQVVQINVSAQSAEPGAEVAAAPSISKNLAQRILANNGKNYKSGQEVIAVLPDGEQIPYKKVGGSIREKGKRRPKSAEEKARDSW